jgi:hypothetical protein
VPAPSGASVGTVYALAWIDSMTASITCTQRLPPGFYGHGYPGDEN